jgi:hypothetical protein
MVAQRQRYDDYDDHDNHVENEKTKKRVRMTFDVAPDLRRRIKLAAINRNMTLNEYLGQVLEEVVPVEEENMQTQHQERTLTHKTLDKVNEISQRILKERNGRPFENTTEMIRQMREERTKYLMEEE